MITPRRTRLVRVPNLHTFRSAIAALAGPASLVVVPNAGAVRQLDGRARAVTRDELYDRLHERLADPPRRLGALERDVIAQAAARAAAERHPRLAFHLRPGLVAEVLRFYDQLRRQSQQVKRFQELLAEALGAEDFDRAAERMRVQTAFLADAFRQYERFAADSGGCDEHMLRDRLIAKAAADPVRDIVITVADWIADADGLYVADFDLLTRIAGLERLDIVCTERVLASGFHERLHNWWPGLEEAGPRALGLEDCGSIRPVLVTPPADEKSGAAPAGPVDLWWTLRDREEELVAVARRIHKDTADNQAVPLDRIAIVYKHPLPYLYAAAGIFGSAGIPYQSSDTLPLAAEPTAAALDLVFDAVSSNFTRSAIVALLRSPHFVFAHDGNEPTRASISALDRFLSESRYLGDRERLAALHVADGYGPALGAAVAVAAELSPLAEQGPASVHLQRVLAFWSTHLRPLGGDWFAGRERRARAAITDILTMLASVHAAHDDPPWTVDDVGLAVRRRIEEHTFLPDTAGRGVQLLDDEAARYAEFDDVVIAGVTDSDWPERPRRNIFYPPSLLKSLGWPSEKDRRAAADARFLDLLGSASRRTFVSTITLEDEALVSRSLQLDDIPRARLSSIAREPNDDNARVFVDEALSIEPVDLGRIADVARSWADVRVTRSPAAAAEYHGAVRHVPARAWSVSAIETYLDCPFKFFAQHVLKLDEEPDDEEVMDPRRQGQFVHDVFERFFRAWQDAGRRAITPDNLAAARALFTEVVEEALQQLPDAEAGLERTRLLGSPAAAGLGEAVFRMEAERPVPVVHRSLETRLDGEFTLAAAGGPRTIALRGKADRIDLLDDGTFRLIDYKLGWPPNRTRALQLPIYGLCAEQRLAPRSGRRWILGEAAYLAFKGPRRVVPLFSPADRDKVLADAQQRLVDTVDAIGRGEFPPTPDDVWRCETCSFASVCRKDYVGDV